METAGQRAEARSQTINRPGVKAVAHCIANGAIAQDTINIHLDASAVAACLDIDQTNLNPSLLAVKSTFTCRRRSQKTKIVAGRARLQPNQTLLKAPRNALPSAEALKPETPIKEIARANRYSDSYAGRLVPLATLSPPLQSAIFDGTLPNHITLETFIRADIPFDWKDREARLRIAM